MRQHIPKSGCYQSHGIVESLLYRRRLTQQYRYLTTQIVVDNPVDTLVLNTYTVTYNVTDSSGNAAATVTRTVRVENSAASGGGGGGGAGGVILALLMLLLFLPRPEFSRHRKSKY